jgi:creatinine amidohydrolase
MLDAASTTWPEIANAAETGLIAFLGIGAVEQHGAHLPVLTDMVMAGGVARRLAEAANGLLLPALPYGEAWTTESYPGTISIQPDTLRALVFDIGASLKRSGIKALVIVNGHFGNREPIALAARRLKVELDFPTLYLDYPGLQGFAEEICDSKPAAPHFYHADEVETSIMLALAPDTVDMSRARPEYPEFPKTFGAEAIELREFNKTGVFGDPRSATAEKGERLLEKIVAESLAVFEAFKMRHGL